MHKNSSVHDVRANIFLQTQKNMSELKIERKNATVFLIFKLKSFSIE